MYKKPSHLRHSDGATHTSRSCPTKNGNIEASHGNGSGTHPVSSQSGRCLCRTPSARGSGNCGLFFFLLALACFELDSLLEGRNTLLWAPPRRPTSPSSWAKGRYVACSCEAHCVLIQIARWGLLCLFRRAGESQPETRHTRRL